MKIWAHVPALLLMGGAAWAANGIGSVVNMSVDEMMEARPSSQEVAAANRFYNVEGVIPPQCYTKIESEHNPCYVCHQSYEDFDRPNYMNDGELQEAYNFSEAALTNHWVNLFVDRSDEVAAISDAEILDYINQDNYTDLRANLLATDWQGYLPDLDNYHLGAEAFDDRGFALDGVRFGRLQLQAAAIDFLADQRIHRRCPDPSA